MKHRLAYSTKYALVTRDFACIKQLSVENHRRMGEEIKLFVECVRAIALTTSASGHMRSSIDGRRWTYHDRVETTASSRRIEKRQSGRADVAPR